LKRPSLVIVTPALRDANNGNWQTAQRWARMLSGDYVVRLAGHWDGGDEALLIALHARRSADAVAAWRRQRGDAPVLLALTGTDLYRDIATDTAAQQSLARADRLVVLNELGLRSLPAELRGKARVCLQSCPSRQPGRKARGHLRALMVGHLRDEKSPQTYFEAARLLAARGDIHLDHIGSALEPALAAEATALMATHPHYRWLGALPHGATRARIACAHVLVHPSRMEGGAHVVMEAICSGTPVLASRIDGNLGLLGEDYPGVFEPGDAAGLAAALQRARDEPAMLDGLRVATDRRAPLFDPARERAALRALVAELLKTGPHPNHPTKGLHERP
jgi:putative glycosyltransferase (TIGR04348 family)